MTDEPTPAGDLQVLDDIPFCLDGDALRQQLHVAPGSADAEALDGLLALAANVGRPKALYRPAYIEARDDDHVTVGGVTFESRMLALNLAAAERLFAFVATCGREVHEAFDPAGDFVQEFWWDAIKARLLAAASQRLTEHLCDTFRLGHTATMSPGSAEAEVWPIEQQEGLFALLGDVRGAIGVELTDSCLMIPNKTVSGIRFPTAADFRSCQVCQRDPCPSRSAAFDEALWRQLQHD